MMSLPATTAVALILSFRIGAMDAGEQLRA